MRAADRGERRRGAAGADRSRAQWIGRAAWRRDFLTQFGDRLFHTPRVLPQILAAYEDGSDYFYQVRAAKAELTAQQWRRALEAAREDVAIS